MNEHTTAPSSSVDESPTVEFAATRNSETPDGSDVVHEERVGVLHHVWQAVSWLLLIGAVAILCAAVLIPKLTGAQSYTVLTGSMKPDYPPGTLIVVKPRPADEIGVGDVITYQIRSGSPEVITHRVIEVTRTPEGEPRFITQGDANCAVDTEPVRDVQIRGTLWYSVPYIGWANNWFTGQRRSTTIFVLAGLLFLYGAWQFVADRREHRSGDELDSDAPLVDPDTRSVP
ncbi:signal peptidase I [Gordonia amicalis]|uniref:signal peptidase I n=1 Tax=Gordonia amicalis TaxID=89053 RepID=UPI0029543D26|nr:signal peptidase I [Gordonia amicalis]MDV7100250.1 signal peptidase I [Gordonia amicalis]